MKTIYRCLLLVSFVLISTFSYSQVRFGVKSGINIATTKNLLQYPKNKIGWNAGGLAIIALRKNLTLRTELLYSSKGHRVSLNLGEPQRIFTRLNYLVIPVLLEYKIDRRTKINFGPEIGWLLSAQERYSSNFLDVSKSYPHKFDIGIDIGIHYSIHGNFGVEARYNYGLNTLYTVDAEGCRTIPFNGANRVFQINLTYLLNKNNF